MKMPRVSFIIPTMNSERTLERCLQSIRMQDYPDIEIIVVDGGSTDRSLEIARKYADKVLLQPGPLGLARARGARLATGDILGILDSDIYLPHKDWLANAVSSLIGKPRAAILWPVNVPPAAASHTARAYFALWEYRLRHGRNPVPGGNILVRKKAYDEVGGIDPRLHFGEDYDLTLKILRRGYTYIVYPDPIIHDTMHSLRQYTRKQFWGARSLSIAEQDIISTTVSWNPDTSGLAKAGVKHLWQFIASIPLGIRRYKDPFIIVYSPLMMAIRAVVYGFYSLRIMRSKK